MTGYDYSTDDIIVDDSVIESKLSDIIQNIENLKSDYLNTINKESLEELTQQQYNGFLMHCAMFYFRPTKCLYKYYQGISNNNQVTIMYDDDLLSLLCEYYINMSLLYNKVVNPHGFSLFIGCDDDLLARWYTMESQRPKAYGLVKKLKKEYETSLENGAQSGKNPVGFIATLNHRFGWNADNKPQLTVNITRTKQEILSSIDSTLIEENS